MEIQFGSLSYKVLGLLGYKDTNGNGKCEISEIRDEYKDIDQNGDKMVQTEELWDYIFSSAGTKLQLETIPEFRNPLASNDLLANNVAEIIKGKTMETEKARAIYDWVATNVAKEPTFYGPPKRLIKYPTDYLNTPGQKALCGEYSMLLKVMLGLAGIKAQEIEVLVDYKGHDYRKDEMMHICVIAEIDGRQVQLDPTYGQFDIKHKEVAAFSDRRGVAEFLGDVGYFYDLSGNPVKAINILDQAIEIAPDCNYCRLNLGTVLVAGNDLDKAIEQYQIIIQNDPEYPQVYFNLAGAYLQKGDVANAIKYLEEHVKRFPDDLQAQDGLRQLKALR